MNPWIVHQSVEHGIDTFNSVFLHLLAIPYTVSGIQVLILLPIWGNLQFRTNMYSTSMLCSCELMWLCNFIARPLALLDVRFGASSKRRTILTYGESESVLYRPLMLYRVVNRTCDSSRWWLHRPDPWKCRSFVIFATSGYFVSSGLKCEIDGK